MGRRLLAILLVVALGTFGCAGAKPSPVVCSVIGQAFGVANGVVIGSEVGGGTGAHAIGGLVGFAVGALAGYYLCKIPDGSEPPEPPPQLAEAPPPPPPARIVLRGVNFGFDSAEIKPVEAVVLDEAASLLNQNPRVRVRVEGYTDSVGPETYNQVLSERRAVSVKNYLVAKGVAAGRLDTVGYGESNPIASNATREGRALNRRVQLQTLQ